MACSPDGRWLVAGWHDSVRLWDLHQVAQRIRARDKAAAVAAVKKLEPETDEAARRGIAGQLDVFAGLFESLLPFAFSASKLLFP